VSTLRVALFKVAVCDYCEEGLRVGIEGSFKVDLANYSARRR
jgi:hypothetical protein